MIPAPRGGEFARIRALRSKLPGFDRDMWREMCGNGWLGLRSAQRFCGLAQQLGAGLAPEPLIAAAMAARLLPPDRLAPVLAGERVILCAWQEKPDSIDLIGETMLHDGRLSGRKLLIPMAAGADAFLVTVPGGLALVERGAPGVSLEIRPTQDGGNFGTLILDNAPAEAIEGDASEALEHAIAAHAAYLLGLTERACAITRDFLKTHEHPQAQRRVADNETQMTVTRVLVAAAAKALDSGASAAQCRPAVSRAKTRVSDAATLVTRACSLMHGAAAYADTADIGLFLRKALVLSPLYGSPIVHRARFRTAVPETQDG